MWEYHITTGTLLNKDGDFVGTGYSGAGRTLQDGRNNPDMTSIQNKGPTPVGIYDIGLPYHHPVEGPCVMNLTPETGTNTFGRSAFHIHGDNARNDASHGCIILGPLLRAAIAKSGDDKIKVTA